MKFGTDKPEWLGDPIDAEEILKICLFILTKFTNVTEFMNVTGTPHDSIPVGCALCIASHGNKMLSATK